MAGMRAEDALLLAIAYIKKSLVGAGALKGKNATIQSITPVAGGNNVTFSWTLDNGTVQTQTMFVKDGQIGPEGKGIPIGGTAGQVLVKKTGTDYDTEWQTLQAGGVIIADATPTQGSTNPVQSGGVFDALEAKQDTLTGTQGQLVGFDAQGAAVPVEAPETGVVTFNGRTGAVTPEAGDYTADMVGAVVTVEESTQNPDYAKTYTIKQNNAILSTINIPKDMVVSAANVVENPQNQPAGKYVELTIANATNDKIYINVADLVDAYTTQQNATHVQLEISATNEISARIVAGSITSTELASNSVTADKIADGNVSKAKLNQDVLNLFDAKQDKITGKQGQTVGFDKDGNVIVQDAGVDKQDFTYVIDSADKFNNWRKNIKTSNENYESVYICKDTYVVGELVSGNADSIGYIINLTTIGTKKIFAETGTIILFNGYYGDGNVIGIGYETKPEKSSEYSIRGLTVRSQVDSNGAGFKVVCFYNMINVTECIAESPCNAKGQTANIMSYGFHSCDNLMRCTTDVKVGIAVTGHTGSLTAIGFKNCTNLLQCNGNSTATSDTARIKHSFGFESCVGMVQCIGTVNQKYVVVCIAGQSNAVGYDESPVDIGGKLIYSNVDSSRIKQLGFYGDDNLKVIDLGHCAQNMQDMTAVTRKGTATAGTKGLHLPLANLMLDYIPDDYGILVLPIAFGGTGFTSGNTGTYDSANKKPNGNQTQAGSQGTAQLKWGLDTPYYNTLKDRIIYALELNPENLFAGIVWCQGENDRGRAADHYSKFQEMTQGLFDALNAHDGGKLKSRVPKQEWDKDIWFNMETVSHWYTTEDCSDVWANYKVWNQNTYIEIPRDTESNSVNGDASTTQTKPRHFGNNAYQKVVAPRVMQKLIDMNTFTKKVNVIEKEVEIPVVTPEPVPEAKTHEDNRLVTQDDIKYQLPDSTFTIDATGKCTAVKDMQGTFDTDGTRIILGEASMIEFTVKRSLYWVIIEADETFQNIVVMGLGRNFTRRVVKINGNSVEKNPIMEQDGNINYSNFSIGCRIRIYRDSNDDITVYYKNPNEEWKYWLKVKHPNAYPQKVFGFAAGISTHEIAGNYANVKNVLFEDLEIWRSKVDSVEREIDVRLSYIETVKETYLEDRAVASTDIKSQTGNITFSVSSGGINGNNVIDTSSISRLYLGDVFRLDFSVSRSLYWIIIGRNPINGDVLLCGVGRNNSGKVIKIDESNSRTVVQDSSVNHGFNTGDKIRVYRDSNGNVSIYTKIGSGNWQDVKKVTPSYEFTEKIFGFIVGLDADEINGGIGASNVLLSNLNIWDKEPFPLARVFDMRLSKLE